jgi:hypothetical protein
MSVERFQDATVCLPPRRQSLTPSLRTTLAANSWLARSITLTWSFTYKARRDSSFLLLRM